MAICLCPDLHQSNFWLIRESLELVQRQKTTGKAKNGDVTFLCLGNDKIEINLR